MHPGNDDDLLQFKDYSNTPSSSSPPPAQISVNSPTTSTGSIGGGSRTRGGQLSDLIYDMSDAAQIVGGMGGILDSSASGGGGRSAGSTDFDEGGGGGGGAADGGGANRVSFLTLEYYQQFFNVDTYMVLERIANAMIPKRAKPDYLRLDIGTNPDLYGPFWITVTLIFSIAISGNIANYLQHANDNIHWHYNFHLVSIASTCIFLYANILPIALWALFKYSLKPVDEDLETQSANFTPSLLSLMCVYGYSLAIYIPVSILWVIQISFLQWLLVITGAFLSGTVLILVLTPALRNSKFSLFLIIGILAAHFLLAAGFMLYFFHVPDSAPLKVTDKPMEVVTKAAFDVAKQAVEKVVVGNLVTEKDANSAT